MCVCDLSVCVVKYSSMCMMFASEQRPEEDVGCLTEPLSTLFPESGSLTALGAKLLLCEPQRSPCLQPHGVEIIDTCVAIPGFLSHPCWDLKGPHGHTVNSQPLSHISNWQF